MRPHVSEKKAHITRGSLDYSPACSPILPCAWPTRPQKRGPSPQRRGEPSRRLLLRENMARCRPLPQSACGCSCRTRRTSDAMALIALDVEVAHFMDRLKQAQNGLIFTFESTLRIDAHESIAAMTPIRKKTVPEKDVRSCARWQARRERAVLPVWRWRCPRMALLY